MLRDLKFSLRLLSRSPGFAAIAILTLALGIGANTAIFSVVYGVLLRPLPYPQPARLVTAQIAFPGGHLDNTDGPHALFWKEHQSIFESVAILGGGAEVNLEGGSRPERISMTRVTPDFFHVLRINPVLGRAFGADPNVAVIAFGLWKRHFGGDSEVLGKAITLGDGRYTIVGVAPPGIDSTLASDVWVPLDVRHDPLYSGTNYLFLARLKDGLSLDQANADMRVLAAQYASENPKGVRRRETAGVFPYLSDQTRHARARLTGMFWAVGMVLLIACVNVANLLLARLAVRRREIALRMALGAARLRVIRQLLTESVCLALAGSLLGLLFAKLAVDLIVRFRPLDLPRLDEVSLDPHALLFTFGVALTTGVLFGLAPAIQALRSDIQESLREGGARTGAGREGNRLREVLVAIEFALSMVLVIGAALLIESFARINLVNPGFDPSRVLTLQVTLSGKRYATSEQVARFAGQTAERFARLPGVVSAATTNYLPLERGFNIPLHGIEGRARRPDEFLGNLEFFGITTRFFEVLGIRVVAGRKFAGSDTAASTPVVIVNEAFAKKYFPRQNALGRRVTIESDNMPREIVGISSDIHEQGLGSETQPDVFVPITQMSDEFDALLDQYIPTTILLRTAGDPLSLSHRALEEMRSIDPLLPVFHVRAMTQVAGDSIQENRFLTLLLGSFAGLALLLAAIGIYGVMSCAIAERTREFGIRAALGAQPAEILGIALKRGLVLAGIGILCGAAGAFALTRLLAGFLYGVSTHDPLAFAAAPLVLAGVALLACYLPARRAMRADPMAALRYD